MCKISVIIPIYNVEPYLKRCLDSVVNQTLSDIEIILINDCSTDNSLEIAQSYTQKDKRIILIDLPINQGAAAARNKGLEVASGEYLGFVDPDDAIDLNFYEELYKKAKETDADIVKGNLILVNLDGTKALSKLNEKITKNGRFEFSYEWTSAIYRNSLVIKHNIKFPEDTNSGEDIVFLYRCLLKSSNFELTDNVKYYYYRRESSLFPEELSLQKISETLLSRIYILEDFDKALYNTIFEEEYINKYFNTIHEVFTYLIEKCKTGDSKIVCVKYGIKFYNMCKIKNELALSLYNWNKNILKMIQDEDIESLYEICIKRKTYKDCMLAVLKSGIKKDLTNV